MPSTEDLVVGRYRIRAEELRWSFGPSGGPGGQHANRSNTRAELRFDVAASDAFPDSIRRRILGRLGSSLFDGVVIVSSDETRSQWRNRSIARRRLADLLEKAMRPPPPSRRPTRPTVSSRRRRLERKRARGDVKRLRRRPEPE